MGYQVYRDPADPSRWAGYGVPALCDWITCSEEIDRGMGYRCEQHGRYALMIDGEEISYDAWDDNPEADEEWVESEGCEMHFCSDHLEDTDNHDEEHTIFKPDTPEWENHILTDESWETWRVENPEKVTEMKERQNA